MPARDRVRALVGLAVLGAILAAAIALGPDRAVAALLELEGSPRLAALLLGLYLARPFLGWPHGPFPVAAGFYFGFAVGTVVALIGLALTSLPPFAVGRYLRTDTGFFGRVGRLADRFAGATGEVRAVAGSRLLPLPADLVSYGAGVAEVRTRPFAIGTLIGDLPWLVGSVVVGSRLERFAAGGIDALDPRLVLALTLAGLVVLGGPLYRRLRG